MSKQKELMKKETFDTLFRIAENFAEQDFNRYKGMLEQDIFYMKLLQNPEITIKYDNNPYTIHYRCDGVYDPKFVNLLRSMVYVKGFDYAKEYICFLIASHYFHYIIDYCEEHNLDMSLIDVL